MKTLIPILFVLIAAGIFFGYVDPTYQRIKVLQEEASQFDQALTRSKELQQVRDQLLSRYNVIPQNNITRLEKMLPDNVDNVRLILDLDTIAARYGMRIRNTELNTGDTRAARGQVGDSDTDIQSVVMRFSVSGSYDTIRSFLEDLERSLRLVDITNISFSSGQTGVYDVAVSIRTYWLK